MMTSRDPGAIRWDAIASGHRLGKAQPVAVRQEDGEIVLPVVSGARGTAMRRPRGQCLSAAAAGAPAVEALVADCRCGP